MLDMSLEITLVPTIFFFGLRTLFSPLFLLPAFHPSSPVPPSPPPPFICLEECYSVFKYLRIAIYFSNIKLISALEIIKYTLRLGCGSGGRVLVQPAQDPTFCFQHQTKWASMVAQAWDPRPLAVQEGDQTFMIVITQGPTNPSP